MNALAWWRALLIVGGTLALSATLRARGWTPGQAFGATMGAVFLAAWVASFA